MKNYQTPSRNFYVNELKKNNKNLIKNNQRLNFLEQKLEILLAYTFKFFHPFFKDDDEL